MFEKQAQSAAEGAIAIQAQGNVHVGLTYDSARQVALDVYQANFPKLVSEAAALARARAEELTDKFLKQLNVENPAGLQQAIQPDFQNALLNAQREHACAGDTDLADLLVDLLVDRTKRDARDLMRLVLDDALKTAPKLTEQQLAVLGAAFVLGQARSTAGHWQEVVVWLNTHARPIVEQAEINSSTFPHLKFAGCATQQGFGSKYLAVLRHTYGGFFQTGLTEAQIQEQSLSFNALKYILQHPEKSALKWVAISSNEVIDSLQVNQELTAEDATKLKTLMAANQEADDVLSVKLVEQLPFLTRAIELWETKKLSELSLSSVGMAIGHAFVKKTLGHEFAPLSLWIN